jgi:uncharacterized phage protein (TIGR02216 family)
MTSDGRERKSQASFLPKPFPWDEVIGFGLGTLRLAPDVFWRMTVRELGHALKAVRGQHAAPLARSDLAALMARFPDAPSQPCHSGAPQSGEPGIHDSCGAS